MEKESEIVAANDPLKKKVTGCWIAFWRWKILINVKINTPIINKYWYMRTGLIHGGYHLNGNLAGRTGAGQEGKSFLFLYQRMVRKRVGFDNFDPDLGLSLALNIAETIKLHFGLFTDSSPTVGVE